MGSGPTHWRSASVVVKVKDLLPGAAQPLLVLLRSYYWCGTQRLLVRLRSDYWRGYAASIIGAATTADQQGGIQILILVLWCCHHGGSAGRCGSGAAQLSLVLLRSYFWCCYAAIIGAATQLSLVRLRSYHWCGYAAIIGAATQLLLCATILILSSCAHSRSSSSSVFPMIIAASIIGAATTADQRNTQKIANEMRM